MASVREGSKGALVVVGVHAGVMDSAWEADRVPAEGEARIFKEYNSSFEKTSLDDEPTSTTPLPRPKSSTSPR
jgi:hypothetical protein